MHMVTRYICGCCIEFMLVLLTRGVYIFRISIQYLVLSGFQCWKRPPLLCSKPRICQLTCMPRGLTSAFHFPGKWRLFWYGRKKSADQNDKVQSFPLNWARKSCKIFSVRLMLTMMRLDALDRSIGEWLCTANISIWNLLLTRLKFSRQLQFSEEKEEIATV